MNNIDQIRAVVFDMDGTLFDTLPSLAAAAGEVLARAGLEPVRAAQLRSALSAGLLPMFRHALQLQARRPAPAVADRLEAEFLLHYERHWLPRATLFPGVPQCLSAVENRGVKLAICTNRDRASTELLLKAADVPAVFDAIVGLGDAGAAKPAPEPLLCALDRLRLHSTQALFVGDSAMDSRCASAAGVAFAAHRNGYATAASDLLPQVFAFGAYEQLTLWLTGRAADFQEPLHA